MQDRPNLLDLYYVYTNHQGGILCFLSDNLDDYGEFIYTGIALPVQIYIMHNQFVKVA